MQSASAILFCPNPVCQALNPESNKFCYQCRSLLPKRYLWAVGAESLRSGDLLRGRYRVKHSQVVLDTQPGLQPDVPEQPSEAIESYLRLSAYQPQVPQVYGIVSPSRKRPGPDLILLEQAPIYPEGVKNESSKLAESMLMPPLTQVWKQSSALRQLNWLGQMAQLWQPFSTEGVAQALLNPALLRVEGSLLRLLELPHDPRSMPSLTELGGLWRRWLPEAQPEIADFLKALCQQLTQGQVQSAEQVSLLLDQAIVQVSQGQVRRIQMVTQTDQGPTRKGNEDACHPPAGTVLTVTTPGPSSDFPLVIVCDGIGGHEGGAVASGLAIATVQKRLQPLHAAPLSGGNLVEQLEQATLAANDVISQRNDSEQRQERQRMGTTLVMGLVQGHELYLTHLGDSRAYRITRTGCYQVTQDDDLAAREVRLGFSLYREALQQPGSGALVQALGMGKSSDLHPTVQKFVLEEDCLFLLCTDGLSDHDRIAENWQAELLPLLEGQIDVTTASQRLVTISNQQNGHDNVTVGLIHCQVRAGDRVTALEPSLGAVAPLPPATVLSSAVPSAPLRPTSDPSTSTTKILPQSRSTPPILRLLGILLLWGVGSCLAYFLIPDVRVWVDALVAGSSRSPQPVAPSPTPASPQPSSSAPATSPPLPPPAIGATVLLSRPLSGEKPAAFVTLLPQPETGPSPAASAIGSSLPVGSVLQVAERVQPQQQGVWLKLKVCSTPEGVALPSLPKSGDTGWMREETIAPLLAQNFMPTPAQLGKCAPAAATPAPSPQASPANSAPSPSPSPQASPANS
jgi:protein phosphatase